MKRPKQKPSGFFPINALPEGMLAEILKRLPVKYVLRCMVVQKSWYNLVKTPVFITLHFNHQKLTSLDRPKYLLFQNNNTNALSVRFDDEQCQEYCSIRHIAPLENIPSDNYVLRASSDGLICMAVVEPDTNTRKIYVWNPLIQKYKTLPDMPVIPSGQGKLGLTCEALAFGFLPEVNNYVVVNVYKPFSHRLVTICVYSLNSNTWKETSHDCPRNWIGTNHSVFVNGAAFWLGPRSGNINIVMCFDTKTEMLREILLPQWMDRYHSRVIHPFGQSLAYFVDNFEDRFDMGVLKGDPMNEYSWEKKMSVSTRKNVIPTVVGLRNNGEPILIFSSFLFIKFMSYNLDSHEASEFLDFWDHLNDFSYNRWTRGQPFVISPFVESLVFLDI